MATYSSTIVDYGTKMMHRWSHRMHNPELGMVESTEFVFTDTSEATLSGRC